MGKRVRNSSTRVGASLTAVASDCSTFSLRAAARNEKSRPWSRRLKNFPDSPQRSMRSSTWTVWRPLPDRPYAFVYFITISNKSKVPITVKGRKWVIESKTARS